MRPFVKNEDHFSNLVLMRAKSSIEDLFVSTGYYIPIDCRRRFVVCIGGGAATGGPVPSIGECGSRAPQCEWALYCVELTSEQPDLSFFVLCSDHHPHHHHHQHQHQCLVLLSTSTISALTPQWVRKSCSSWGLYTTVCVQLLPVNWTVSDIFHLQWYLTLQSLIVMV